MRLFNLNGYWGSFDEGLSGSLCPGKFADMAILSANPLKARGEALKAIRAERIFYKGRAYASKARSPAVSLIKGMLSRSAI